VYLLYGSLASAEHSTISDRRLPTKDSTLDDVPSLPLAAAAEEKAPIAAAKAADNTAAAGVPDAKP
jgi:hypothetical protein